MRPSDHWKGHLLLFDATPTPTSDAPAGLRLLLIFVALEGVLGPRLSMLHWLGLPLPPSWLRIPILLGLTLLAVRFVAGLKLIQIGFRPWREWSGTEKSYFVQVFVVANVVFSLVFADRRPTPTMLAEPAVVLASFTWGFHQEVVYRGILQTELVRRWGSTWGILVSNALFTFGPLHFYHFARGVSALPMFAGIFVLGLFFAALFRRSGNLWMVAIFHGLGCAYILGS